MKKRVLTGIIGGAAVIAWLFTLYTPFFPIVLVLGSAVAAYEMLKVFEVKNLIFKALCEILSMFIPLYFTYGTKLKIPMFPFITAIVIGALIIMVADFKNLSFEQIACSLLSCSLIPSALSCIILFRNVYIAFPSAYKKSDGVFFILFALFACWVSDIFALFTGIAFGKHKLAPRISPKKTVEGAVGGIAASAIANIVLYFIFKRFFALASGITLPAVIITSIFLSVTGIFGDLSASTIKRRHGIKDFGNILPGHGGLMDRIDSCVFVFPVLYAVISVINAI